jgi:hypothetical protein
MSTSNTGEIVNRVAKSPLVTLDMKDFYQPGQRVVIDLKDQLFQGLILKEKDFRTFVSETDWSAYGGTHVAVCCSADAIIPVWAYMLIASSLSGIAQTIVYGNLTQLESVLFEKSIAQLDPTEYQDAKVVIKGCSDITVPESAFMRVTAVLRPYVSSIMYGEPCSTVPVYKKPRPSDPKRAN